MNRGIAAESMSSTPATTSTLTPSLTSSQWSSIGSRCLRRSHTDLVEGVDPQYLVDYLFQEDLLSVEDLEMVHNLPTRSHRMRHLLTVVHGRLKACDPEVVLRHFLLSLNRDYRFLETKLRESLDQLIDEEINKSKRRENDVKQTTGNRDEDAVRHLANVTNETTEGKGKEEEEDVKYPVMETEGLVASKCYQSDSSLSTLTMAPPSELVGKSELMLSAPPGECVVRMKTYASSNSTVSPPGELLMNFSLLSNRQGVFDFGPLLMPPSNRGKRFKSPFHRKIFDLLSNSVNDQHFDHYFHAKNQLSTRASRDPDTKCLILYMDACKSAIKSDFSAANQVIDESLRLATVGSSAPNKFCALFLSVRVWINLKRRKLNKADRALTEALNVVSQDPVTCSGMTAGWLYVDEAKLLMARMTSTMRHADVIRRRAVTAMERAIEQFRRDDSADGPYGVNFASVKLASLLLACDDQLTLVDLVDPTDDDVTRADALLTSVDDSASGIPAILKPLFLVALADRKFRSGNVRRAVELAADAAEMAARTELGEEEVLAGVRVECYSRRLMSAGWGHVTVPALPASDDDEADVEESEPDDVIAGNGNVKTTRRRKKTRMTQDDEISRVGSSSSRRTACFRSKLGFGRSLLGLLKVFIVFFIIPGVLYYEASCLNEQLKMPVETLICDRVEGRL